MLACTAVDYLREREVIKIVRVTGCEMGEEVYSAMGVGEELPPRCDKWSAQARFTEIKKKLGPTLFFFDDCDRIVDSPEFETLVRSLLDECPDTKVLLTCRAENFATEHSIELLGISKNEAW